MKRWFSMFALALSIVACAPSSDEPPNEAESQDEAVSESSAALTATPIDLTLDPTPVELLPGWGFEDTPTSTLGPRKCTPEKQMNCDACVDHCDYLCDRPNGGGSGGDCIGLFCPTRCDVCVLSCYKTCGKCIPSQF